VETVGQGEVGGNTCKVQIAWLTLDWLQEHLSWLWVSQFRPPLHEWAEQTVVSPCTVPISGREAFFPV